MKREIVYALYDKATKLTKIGRSKNFGQRLRNYSKKERESIKIMNIINSNNPPETENLLQIFFNDKHRSITRNSKREMEWFELNPEDTNMLYTLKFPTHINISINKKVKQKDIPYHAGVRESMIGRWIEEDKKFRKSLAKSCQTKEYIHGYEAYSLALESGFDLSGYHTISYLAKKENCEFLPTTARKHGILYNKKELLHALKDKYSKETQENI